MKPEKKIDDSILLQKHSEGVSGIQLAELFGCSRAAISKRLKRLCPPPLPPTLEKLTSKQLAFCQRIVLGESATSAAFHSHDVTSRESAKEVGYRLMKNPDIQCALTEIMNDHGLTRDYRVKKLKQHCESPDPGIGLKALSLAFELADEKPAVRTKNLNVNVEGYCPVDLSRYS